MEYLGVSLAILALVGQGLRFSGYGWDVEVDFPESVGIMTPYIELEFAFSSGG